MRLKKALFFCCLIGTQILAMEPENLCMLGDAGAAHGGEHAGLVGGDILRMPVSGCAKKVEDLSCDDVQEFLEASCALYCVLCSDLRIPCAAFRRLFISTAKAMDRLGIGDDPENIAALRNECIENLGRVRQSRHFTDALKQQGLTERVIGEMLAVFQKNDGGQLW